ncbi:DUF397 domain-containing protein [Sphaerisporangium album]|uniref:DUF397 domain-containing protein n=1 Tax=Sphaerisporangium album TaxID=509200 RepID=A0A367FCS4_9ACTN|nr:DUF397 domain-containing protein [Sphaerisporangium album]RCG28168.1 DUF397 domain-containing protein [Sphaerisporangium album]
MDRRTLSSVDLSKAAWQKSARSGGTGGGCVEVARNLPGVTAVRDSKNPDGPVLLFVPGEWGAFLNGVRRDDLTA